MELAVCIMFGLILSTLVTLIEVTQAAARQNKKDNENV